MQRLNLPQADKANSRRGGNHQPLGRVEGSDLDYAKELFDALERLDGPRARLFRREQDALRRRWEPWCRAVLPQVTEAGRSATLSIHHIRGFFGFMEQRRFVEYPKPRSLTEAEQCELNWRLLLAQCVSYDLFAPLAWETHGDANPRWMDAQVGSDAVFAWANEIRHAANPGRKRRRSRGLVGRYRRDVEAFCRRWNLNAWWAAPAIINSHFQFIEFGFDSVMAMYSKGIFDVIRCPLIVPLPGYSQERAEADAARFRDVMLERKQQDVSIIWRPQREQLAEIEVAEDSACIVLDWDGWSTQQCRFGHREPHKVLDWAIEECESRLARMTTKRERGQLSKELTAQIREAEKLLLETESFRVEGKPRIDLHAEWVAERLLDPDMTYNRLEARHATHRDQIRHACNLFAARAGLALP